MCCAVLDQTSNTPGLLTSEMDTNYLCISPHSTFLSCSPRPPPVPPPPTPTHLPCPPCKWWSCVPHTLCCAVKGVYPLVVREGGSGPCLEEEEDTLRVARYWGCRGGGRTKGELVIINHLTLYKHLLTYLNKKDNSNVVCLYHSPHRANSIS